MLNLARPEDLIRNEATSSGTCDTWRCRAIDNLGQLRRARFTRRMGPGMSTTTFPSWLPRPRTCSQAQGLDRIGRRAGHRRQVLVGLSNRARSEYLADPHPGRRPGRMGKGRPGLHRPCRRKPRCWRGTPTGGLFNGHRTAGGAGGAVPSRQQHVDGRRRFRPQHNQAGVAVCSSTRWIGITSTSSRSARWRPSPTVVLRTSAGRCTGPSWFPPRR